MIFSLQDTTDAPSAELPQKGKSNKKSKTLPANTNVKIDRLAREARVRPNSVQQILLKKNGNPLGLGIVAAKVSCDALN